MLTDGRIEDATPDALAILGLSLDDARALPPGALSPEPPDPDASEAFREQWEAEGRPDVGGHATLQRLDGSRVRIRFAITPAEDDRYTVVLEPIPEPVSAPPKVWTGGQVLAAWREAERSLTALTPESQEWRQVEAEIERLRQLYQDLFRR